MPFNSEDRAEIVEMLTTAMREEAGRRFTERIESLARTEASKESRLYLITLAGHNLAFPDENGRAILVQCVYAKVSVDPASPSFFGGTIEVIALGEGRLLKTPVKLTLTGGGVVGMVEVPEGLLKP